MEPTPLTMRREALSWWQGMDANNQRWECNRWREISTSRRSSWPFELVAHSDSTIERIYRESILGENFDN